MSDGFLKDFDSCLRGFNSKAKKLEKYSKDFLILISYNIRGNQNLITTNSNNPDDLYIEAVLLRFRPFYLQEEATNFLKICKLVKNYKESEIRSEIKVRSEEWKKTWQEIGGNHYKLELNGEIVDTFDLWLYGEYYHLDIKKNKAQKLSYIKGTEAEGLTKFYFIDILQRYIQ
jgi:hypothetical protein